MAIDLRRLARWEKELPGLLLKLCQKAWRVAPRLALFSLAVLGLHYLAAATLMRSAGLAEPGEPQGYFTSGEQPAASAPGRAENSQAAGVASSRNHFGGGLVLADPSSRADAANAEAASAPASSGDDGRHRLDDLIAEAPADAEAPGNGEAGAPDPGEAPSSPRQFRVIR